jgi:hypothetical protein
MDVPGLGAGAGRLGVGQLYPCKSISFDLKKILLIFLKKPFSHGVSSECVLCRHGIEEELCPVKGQDCPVSSRKG